MITKEKFLHYLIELQNSPQDYDYDEISSMAYSIEDYLINQQSPLPSEVEDALKYLKESSLHNEDRYAQEALYYIEQSLQLQPPTEGEVCMVLSDYLTDVVKYNKEDKKFYSVYEDEIDTYIYMNRHGEITFGTNYPLPLVKMIVQFYEGLGDKK